MLLKDIKLPSAEIPGRRWLTFLLWIDTTIRCIDSSASASTPQDERSLLVCLWLCKHLGLIDLNLFCDSPSSSFCNYYRSLSIIKPYSSQFWVVPPTWTKVSSVSIFLKKQRNWKWSPVPSFNTPTFYSRNGTPTGWRWCGVRTFFIKWRHR